MRVVRSPRPARLTWSSTHRRYIGPIKTGKIGTSSSQSPAVGSSCTPRRTIMERGTPRVLAAAELAGSIGNGAFYACSALFFTRIVGLSATEVGVALTVGWASGMLAGVPLGGLADR